MVSWRRSSGSSPDQGAAGDGREGPREPTPAAGEDVPDVVLDELRQAFTGTPPSGAEAPTGRMAEPTFDLDALPPAEFDDLSGPLVGGPRRAGGTEGAVSRSGPLAASDAADALDESDALGLDDLPLLEDLDDLPEAEPWVVDVPPTVASDSAPTTASHGVTNGRADPTRGPVFESATGDVRLVPRDPSAGAARPPIAAGADRPAAERATAERATAERATAERATIVIGGDDDLPDAVFLDDAVGVPVGEAAERVERGTIVLGDELEASGAFDAVAIPSRSMDPRVRARRIAVKRAQGRRRLLWVAGIAGVVLVVVAILAVFASGLFAVERVDVQGAPYTEARYGDRLQAVVDDLMGEPVLLVDTRAAELALESLPWVERAFVRTDFPNRVFIDVRERQPLATFIGSDGRYRVIDREGFVLDVLVGRPAGYLLLEGLGPDLEPGASAGAPYAAAAQLVGALPAEIRALTVAATVDPTTGDLGLVLQWVPPAEEGGTGDPELVSVRIGSFNGLDAKLARLLQLIRDGLDDASPIDVSTDDVIG